MNAAVKNAGGIGSIENLVSLIDELIAITDEENKLLKKGWPASQLIPFKRKAELAEQFQPWAIKVAQLPSALFTTDKDLHSKLVERLSTLQAVVTENITNLRAAIEASERRIAAVMSAIREQMASNASYNCDGYASRSNNGSYVASLQA